MSRARKIRMWKRGLLGAVVNSVTTTLSVTFIKPEDFNFTSIDGLESIAKVIVGSAFIGAVLYLKQHPQPEDELPVKGHFKAAAPLSMIALASFLFLSGCSTIQLKESEPWARFAAKNLGAIVLDQALSDKDREDKKAIIGALSGFVGTFMTGEPMTAEQVEKALGEYLPDKGHWSLLASGLGDLSKLVRTKSGEEGAAWLSFWGSVSLGLSEATEL
jgi:hypothetical protein